MRSVKTLLLAALVALVWLSSCLLKASSSEAADRIESLGTEYPAHSVIIIRAVASQDRPKNQWYREQLKISPKYAEKSEGVSGMSWAYLLTMAFLATSLVGIVFLIYLWNKRTKIILTSLMCEENKNESESGVR